MNWKKSLALVLAVLILDQAVKIYVKTHFLPGEAYPVTSWFQILFVENNGIAFGLEFGNTWGKLFLTLFRLVAVIFILIWLRNALRKRNTLLAVAVSLILAGALGNIIDSVFYGKIFSASGFHEVAKLFPPDGGYGTWFKGRVVDMLYFPLFEVRLPGWFPFFGGRQFTFFNAIFNLADASITIGVLLILLFNKRIFGKK